MLEIGVVFLVIIVLMVIGVPIAFAFGAGGLILLYRFNVDPQWATMQGLNLISAFTLLAAPLYVLLGSIINKSGMAERIIEVADAFLSRIKGGIGIGVIVANAFFGAMSGSAMASLGGLGRAFLPVMERQGYPLAYGISILIPSAVLSLLIPPSSNMIVFGFIGRLSIARCFLAGIVPGLILMTFLSITHLIIFRFYCPNAVIPEKVSFKEQIGVIGKSIWKNSLTLAVPVVVLGVIYGGIATPTESAAIGALYCLIIGLFVYKTIKINEVGEIFFDSAKVIGSIMLLVFFFLVLSRVLIIERVSEQLLELMMRITTNKYGLMSLICVFLLFLGMIIDDGSVAIISSILLLPIAKKIGFDPYHFMVIVVLLSGAGLITPPVAPLLYFGGYLAGNIPLKSFAVPVLLFLIGGFLPTLILVIIFPGLATYLPYVFMG